jgi:sulfur-oxidizing protein SoxZ
MSAEIKLRARAALEGDTASVRTLVYHPNENGLARNSAGALIPAHHLTQIEILHNGRVVVAAQVGGGLSRDPAIGWRIPGAKAGDRIVVRLADSKGGAGMASLEL